MKILIYIIISSIFSSEPILEKNNQSNLESLNRIGEYGYPTIPLYDRAQGYLLQGKAKTAMGNNGNFITFSDNPIKHWYMPFNGDGAFAGIADNEEDFYLSIQR